MPPYVPTPEQQAVLDHELGRHARILAGPGTGKSATVVGLINRLLSQETSPRIRLLTFTRAATAELARKVAEHPAAAAQRPSTIHSFAISVLLRNPGAGGFPEPLRIADDWEKGEIVHRTLGRRIGVRTDRIGALFHEFASNWESLEERASPRVKEEDRGRFLGGWREHRQVFGYTLLAELPYALRLALEAHPDLPGLDYDLIVVDEYQDLNACDIDLLRIIAARGAWIVAVGDDDQSIYSFRRAAPEGIRRFPADYPGSADYPLTIAQRCGTNIITWARHVIEGDPDRDPARPALTPRPDAVPGEVALLGFGSEAQEAQGVASLIEVLRREGVPAEEILVLLRSDHDGVFSRPIRAALAERGIPVSEPDAVVRVLEEHGNRRLLAHCRILAHLTDSLAWATLLTLEQGIGSVFMDHIYDLARRTNQQFGDALLVAYEAGFPDVAPALRTRARELVGAVLGWVAAHPLQGGVPADSWGTWLLGLAPANGPQPTNELRELLNGVDEVIEPTQDLGRYLGQITPLARDIAASSSEGVRIMSMYSSKGLTVRATVIPALEDGIVPRPDVDLAEERRLLYVAMTRSTQFLFGTFARQRRGPTARAGRVQVAQRRQVSSLLADGPVRPQDGASFLSRRLNQRLRVL